MRCHVVPSGLSRVKIVCKLARACHPYFISNHRDSTGATAELHNRLKATARRSKLVSGQGTHSSRASARAVGLCAHKSRSANRLAALQAGQMQARYSDCANISHAKRRHHLLATIAAAQAASHSEGQDVQCHQGRLFVKAVWCCAALGCNGPTTFD